MTITREALEALKERIAISSEAVRKARHMVEFFTPGGVFTLNRGKTVAVPA